MKPLAIFVFLSSLAVFTAYSADYYVSTAGSDSNPGTQAQPFATIQHAIDMCPQTPTSNIHLDASTWNESPTIVSKDIKLVGDYNGPNGLGGRNNSHINGMISSTGLPLSMGIFDVQSLNAFGIVRGGDSTVYSPATINDCDLSNPSGYGISGWYISVNNCTIHDCNSSGLSLIRPDSVTNSIVHDNNGTGIAFSAGNGGNAAIINSNTVYNNDGDGISGYHFSMTIDNNSCFDNVGNGINVTPVYMYPPGGSCYISNNTCHNNQLDGIKASESTLSLAGIIASGNHCYGNVLNGMECINITFQITNSILGSETVEPGNSGSGLSITDPNTLVGSQINDNIIRGNGQTGITFNNICQDKIYNNTIQNNQSYGVYITGRDCNPDLGGGALSSTGGNTFSGNGTYDFYDEAKNSLIYAKYNHWDAQSQAEMAGHNPKEVNVTRIYDLWDYGDTTHPFLGIINWSNPILSKAGKGIIRVQSSTVGQIKANYR